ncbi:autotransporter domain-containing protein [Reyranella sp.]|uniref:autotransporter family protein n=1 Tax=Reyranella sp. TaxID=1929291 RepID=UPI003784FED0
MARRLACFLAAMAGSSLASFAAVPALAQPVTPPSWNLYTSNTSLVVQYPEALNHKNSDGTFGNHSASLNVRVAGSNPISVTIDTGSTGMAISQKLLPADALNGLTPIGPGTYNYDSSNINPSGYYYQLPVSVLGGTVNGQATDGKASVKVLVVTSDDTTAYFGIGNNRNNAYTGIADPHKTIAENIAQGIIKPMAPVGLNPLLDVSVNGAALPNQGYVVMNDRIVVGLTTANNTYTFVKLKPDAAGNNLWNQIPVALSNGTGKPYVTGTILQDTGIFNGYLKPFAGRGDTVSIAIPGMPPEGAFYSFVMPDARSGCPTASAMQPCEVLGSTSTEPFLNTGRQFYAGFNYLFDPINGYAGYALSSSGLAPEAKLTPLLALQDTVSLANGFVTNLPTALFAATTLTTSSAGTATFNGTFAGYGNSLTLGGSGTVVFNGPVDMGTGGTIAVSSGAIATINNTLTASSVTNHGTLGGVGTVNGDVINSGVISPGNSIGTFTIAGNYTHSARGAHLAEVHPSGIGDKVVIAGAAAIQGGALNVVTHSGIYAPRTTYNLITAGSGLSGSFSSVNSTSPFLVPTLSYDANNAYLTLQIGGFAAAAQTPTQAAVGAALDAAAPSASGDFATILGTIASLSSSQVLPFLTSISGQNYSAFSNSMVQGAQLFMNNFALQVGGGNVGPRGSTRVALAEACTVACQTFLPPTWGAWGGALGGTGTVGSGATSGATTYNVGGFAAGLDRLLTSNVLAGVTVGYTTSTQWVSGFSGQSSTNTFQVGLYGSFFEGPFYLDGMASYAYSTNQMWRNIAIPNLQQRTAQGLSGANQFFGQLEGGYRIMLGGTAMAFATPFARLQGYTGTQNAFTETGAQSLNLSVEAQTTNSLRSVIGALLGGSMDLGWRDRVYAQLRLGWSHEYADVSRPVTAALAGAPRFLFTTWGATPTRDGAVVGLSATTEVAQASSIYLRYEGNIAGQDSTHALTAGLRMTW